MLDVFLATLSPMLVLLLCIIVGFVLNKKKLCPENTTTVLSKLETTVLCPALNISTFSRYCTVSSLSEQYKLVLYSLLAVVLAIGLSYALSPLFEKKGYTRNVYKYAIAFSNHGFMGNAIVPAILGGEMLYSYMLFALPLNIFTYTWGLSILIPKGNERQNPLKKLVNPILMSVLIGAALGLSGLVLPDFISTALQNLGSCMGPIAMILTGFVIGSYSLKSLLTNKKVYIATALRLFVIPAFFIVLLKLLGADNTVLTMCLFGFATPLGLNTVVFPAAYGGDTAPGAAMAMVSHTLCVITIPIMYMLLTAFIL